jgi:hypothetical protein
MAAEQAEAIQQNWVKQQQCLQEGYEGRLAASNAKLAACIKDNELLQLAVRANCRLHYKPDWL